MAAGIAMSTYGHLRPARPVVLTTHRRLKSECSSIYDLWKKAPPWGA